MKRLWRHPLVPAMAGLFLLASVAYWLSGVAGRSVVAERLASIERSGIPVTLEGVAERYYASGPPAGEDAGPLLEEILPRIETERNALRNLRYWPVRERIPGEPLFTKEAHDEVSAILDNHADVLEGLRIASGKVGARFTLELADGKELRLPQVDSLWEGIMLLALNAGRLAHMGDPAAAAEELVAAFNLTRFLADKPTMLSHLTHAAGLSIGLHALEGVLSVAELSEDSLLGLDAILQEAETPVIRRALEGELSAMNAALKARSGGIWEEGEGFGLFSRGYVMSGLYYRDWLRYLDVMESLLQAADLDDQIAISLPYAELDWDLYPLRPAFSDFFYFERVFRIKRNDNAIMRMARILLAAERYRMERGAWPELLPDLTPDFLEALPPDPAGGQFQMATDGGWLQIFSHVTIGPKGEERPLSVRLPLERSARNGD